MEPSPWKSYCEEKNEVLLDIVACLLMRNMQQLLARVNDKTEHPDRPWVVEDTRGGRRQWVYYGNYDWWHTLYKDKHPTTQHNVSFSGGTKDIKFPSRNVRCSAQWLFHPSRFRPW